MAEHIFPLKGSENPAVNRNAEIVAQHVIFIRPELKVELLIKAPIREDEIVVLQNSRKLKPRVVNVDRIVCDLDVLSW